jgi:pimeloyl-ACP methyl ester carboxylesterase
MKLHANGIDIEYQDTAEPDRPVVLLIMGLGMQLIAWPENFIQTLRNAGFRVICFDNRDAGLSTSFEHAGVPNLLWAGFKHKIGLQQKPIYTLQDMAKDAIGLIDQLRLPRVHVLGISMGGMIAQRIAITAPEKLRSLVSIMSSSGADGLPGPDSAVLKKMFSPPGRAGLEGAIEHAIEFLQLIGSPQFPQSTHQLRQRVEQAMRRSSNRSGILRQTLAVMADNQRAQMLSTIRTPTLVLHGEADRMVPLACGQDTARRIPGSQFQSIPGMGHDLAPGVIEILLQRLIPFFHEHS